MCVHPCKIGLQIEARALKSSWEGQGRACDSGWEVALLDRGWRKASSRREPRSSREGRGEAESKLLPGRSRCFRAETYGDSTTRGRCIHLLLPPMKASVFSLRLFCLLIRHMGSHLHGWVHRVGNLSERLGGSSERAVTRKSGHLDPGLVWHSSTQLCDLGESPHLSALTFLICGKEGQTHWSPMAAFWL